MNCPHCGYSLTHAQYLTQHRPCPHAPAEGDREMNAHAARRDRARAARNHQRLLAALEADGHNVAQWADDPYLLAAYADAINFAAYAANHTPERPMITLKDGTTIPTSETRGSTFDDYGTITTPTGRKFEAAHLITTDTPCPRCEAEGRRTFGGYTPRLSTRKDDGFTGCVGHDGARLTGMTEIR